MDNTYSIASLRWRLQAPHFRFAGLRPFAVESTANEPLHEVAYDPALTTSQQLGETIDTFDFPDAEAICRLYRTEEDFLFKMTTASGVEVLFRIPDQGIITTNYAPGQDPSLFRFGFWMAFNLRASAEGILAIHSSTLIHGGMAVLCLGESGTGKSTHTRLWREHIAATELLNDDSPLLRQEGDRIIVYGSPWSGKTPCYRTEHYPIRAFLRLKQAPENRIERLSTLAAYAALQPSFPPSFMHDEQLTDRLHSLLSVLLKTTEVYRLNCLPNAEAAQLAYETLYPHDHENQ